MAGNCHVYPSVSLEIMTNENGLIGSPRADIRTKYHTNTNLVS
jgi:hypothetical protein